MDGLPDVGLGGLLRDIYRDLRKIVIGIFKVLLYIPIQICQRLKRKWELRQHRSNSEGANVNEIWENAKPGVKRRLKNDGRFLYYEYNSETTVNMAGYIDRALDSAKMTKSDEPSGDFVLSLEVSQFFVQSEYFDAFRAIVIDEITRSFNRHFELQLLMTNTESLLHGIQESHRVIVRGSFW